MNHLHMVGVGTGWRRVYEPPAYGRSRERMEKGL
jgi:hypothetical protein